MLFIRSLWACWQVAVLSTVLVGVAGQAQFSDSSTQINFGLETLQNGSATDLHLQLAGSTSNGWAAVGIGSQMSGALMFIIYPSSSGSAVTVSVRTASGHVMPRVISSINYAVQQSSISGSTMTADIMCYGCTSWSGGSLDVSSTKQSWIYAVGSSSDSGLASDDVSASIRQHSREGGFTVDMTAAASSGSSSSSSSSSSGSSSTGNSGSSSGSSSSGSGTSGGSGTAATSSSSSSSNTDMLIMAHAGMLIAAFVGIFPLGVIALRMPWKVGFASHWVFQLTGTVLAFAGGGIAIAFSRQKGEPYSRFSNRHQILGLVVILVLLAQIVAGALHHRGFKKTGRRSMISWGHMMLGRAIIILAMLNAVLGFRLANKKTPQIIIGVVSLGVLLIMEVLTFLFRRRSQRAARSYSEPKPNTRSEGDHRRHHSQVPVEPPQYR